MWEAINPTSFMVPAIDNSGTFTHPAGLNDTVSDPLTPFTMSDGSTPYTTTASRYLKDFGYSYPEIQDWLLTEEELSKNVTAWVNTHYNPTGATKRSKRADATSKEWSVALSAVGTAFGVNEKYVVELAVSGTKFGEMFVSPPPAADAERMELDATTNFEFDVDEVLAKSGIDNEDVEAVNAFLKSGLECSAKKVSSSSLKYQQRLTLFQADRTSIPCARVPGIHMVVNDVDVTPASDITEFPHYGTKTPHADISRGKTGTS